MIENIKADQSNFYNFIETSLDLNKKISHAYFIETSNYNYADDIVLDFAKKLCCYNISDSILKKEIIKQIDESIYSNLYIVDIDGSWIKKEQIVALKEEFCNKSLVEGINRVYIIKNADKLNKTAANRMLKFLEEPEEGIIGILVANNRYNVITTLLSRCQCLKLDPGNINTDNASLLDEMYDFIMNIERSKLKTICYINELWSSKYKTKEDYFGNFCIIQKIYMECLKYKTIPLNDVEHCDDIEFIINKNSSENIVNKIKKIEDYKNDLQFNANLNLLMDRVIIDLSGGVEIG